MGNSARRKELAKNRREDRKNEQERKAKGAKFATPAEIRARLLGDCKKKGIPTENLIAWSENEDLNEEKLFCAKYLRNGSCEVKRCRFSHSLTLSHLKGMIPADESNGINPIISSKLQQVSAGCKLVYDRTIRTQVRQKSLLRFIQFDDTLVFDSENPTVFAAYNEREIQSSKPDFPLNCDGFSDFELEEE